MKSLDFTGSGQAKREVSQLVSGDVVLMNALDLMEWDDRRTQVLICDHCGIVGCESGGWVNLRKAGDVVLMIPVFDEIESDAWSSPEYAPPKYLRKSGTPYFTIADYQFVVDRNVGFPESDAIPDLKMSEAVRLVQAEMPYQMFGQPPLVEMTRVKKSLVVAASEGEHQRHLDVIERLLLTHYNDRTPTRVREIQAADEAVYLFLDADEFIDWKVLVRTDFGDRLVLDENWVIEATSTSSS